MRPPALFLAPLLLAPLLGPLAAALPRESWAVFRDHARLTSLAGNSALLALIACLVAVPLGALTALLLERVPFRGARLCHALIVASLFVPLPVTAVAWQVVLGTWLAPAALAPGEVAWRAWSQGLLPAGWVHGAAGWPWAVVTVGTLLRATDPGLEDDALLTGGPRALFRRVTLPRLLLGSLAAAAWVTVQTLTEIPVTDAMMVRSFAEEVYTQLVGASDGVGQAVAATVPPWLLAFGVAALLGRRALARPVTSSGEVSRPRLWKLPPAWTALLGVAVALAVTLVVLLPVAALAWKAGGGASRAGWTAHGLFAEVGKVGRTDGRVFLSSLAVATVAGLATAGAAWWAVRRAVASRRFALGLFLLAALLAVTPGPIIGLGLKQSIGQLVEWEVQLLGACGASPDFPPLRSALYDQPSPLPVLWAMFVRWFPVAVVVLWPAVHAVPKELWDAARMDGVGAWGEWRDVLVPLTGRAFVVAALAVAALSLGEVSAAKLVNPPSRAVFVLRLFDQMHYGAETTVAALALLPLAPALAVGLFVTRGPRDGR